MRLPGFRRLIASTTEDVVREVLSQNPRAGRRERQEAARVFGSADSQAEAMVGRDRERALDRVTAAYERTASFTQMRLV